MNYLELCQAAATECDVSGPGPTTVLNNVGELKRICNWVAVALNDIETAHDDWSWMLQTTLSFQTVAGQSVYTPAQCGINGTFPNTFGAWELSRFRNYPTAVGNIGEISMGVITYDEWDNAYNFGATRYVQTRPCDIAVHANKNDLCVGPASDGNYTITGEFYRAPQKLTQDGDVPTMPERFHMAIVYKAMMYYGMYESAPEVLARGETEFQKMMWRMTAQRLPDVEWG